jgi:hypothetical protein
VPPRILPIGLVPGAARSVPGEVIGLGVVTFVPTGPAHVALVPGWLVTISFISVGTVSRVAVIVAPMTVCASETDPPA